MTGPDTGPRTGRSAGLRGFCAAAVLAALLSACGSGEGDGFPANEGTPVEQRDPSDSIFSLFSNVESSRELNVNKHLWAASLDVISILPLESVDPFSGVITTGWGRVAPGAPVYRSTIFVSGPALEARSLRVAVFRQSGSRALAVDDEIAAQIEDSILTRARQLRFGEETR